MAKAKPDLLAGLGAFLKARTYTDQLAFWTAFREKHRSRIANTEAPLATGLLKAVDERIALLTPLANAEVSHG